MPLLEVDEIVLKALRDNNIAHVDRTAALAPTAEAAAAWQKVLNSTETRGEALRLWKKLHPEAVIPELDAARPVNDAMSAITKRLDDWEAAQAKREEETETRRREADALDTVSKGRTWLRRERRLDDEAVSGVEEIMKTKGIADYEAAFDHWKAKQPADPTPLPHSTLGRGLDWFKAQEDKPDHALMLKDPIAWRRQEVVRTLQGIRSGEMATQ
jgi:hypothetical protein